jgi:serine phosphatase RsbU (regulator of sigma subunit)
LARQRRPRSPGATELSPTEASSEPTDLASKLALAELTISGLQAERDRLESMVVRLGASAAQLDAESLVEGITEAARDLTGAQLAMFVPAERAALTGPTIVCGPDELITAPEPARAPLLAGALWRITPVRLDDANEWDGGSAVYGLLSNGGVLRSWVGAPVRTRYGDALGGLYLAHSKPHAFGAREEELAQSLASHLGASLDNLTVFQERSRVAQALQQTLLPPVLPEVDGLEVAVRYRPAKSSSLVGGDFYDMFEARSDVWGLMIGDVTGVGPEAAALTGIARYAARALAAQENSPSRLLRQLNETLVGFGLQDRFCTVLYAELHPGRDVLKAKIANGGHPHPYILRSDGRVEEVAITGTLLGLLSDVTFEELEVDLGPGDLLVAYTDGVTEARNPTGAFFGTDGLVRALPACRGRPAPWVAHRIELAVTEHQAGAVPDDIAIVVVQGHPDRPTEQVRSPRHAQRGS